MKAACLLILQVCLMWFFMLYTWSSVEDFQQARNAECLKYNITWQPQVLVIGPSIVDAQQVFVLLDTAAYEAPNVLKWVGICFQVFLVFNVEYQQECKKPMVISPTWTTWNKHPL